MSWGRRSAEPGQVAVHWPGLDGMRGLAVAAVIAFHGGAGAIGGALGVDLFLVLSGFLITTLLLEELGHEGRVDLVAFWGRRARRLLPALLTLVVLVTAVVVIRPLVGAGYPMRDLRDDGLATLGYVANWRYVFEGGDYFAAFVAPSPFRHTWSLAVEEQWYLVWPVAFWWLHRLTRGRPGPLLAVTGGLALASAALMWLLAGDVDRVHYGTDTRAQGLLAGAALAVAVDRYPVHRWSATTRRALGAAGWIGAGVAAWMIVRVGGTQPWLYQGGHLLFAVAGTAVIAAALVPGTVLTRILSFAPLRWVGLISYGLYLWHWPLFIWLSPDRTGLGRWPLFGARVLASLAVALLSYRLIEQPVRLNRLRLSRPITVGLTATAAAAVVVFAMGLTRSNQASMLALMAANPREPYNQRMLDILATGAAIDPPSTPTGPLHTAPLPPVADGILHVVVVGDSTGFSLAAEAGSHPRTEIHNSAIVGCGLDATPALLEGEELIQFGVPVACEDAADLSTFAATADPDVVLVVMGAWEVFDRAAADGSRLEVGSAPWRAWIVDRTERLLRRLAAAAPHAHVAIAEVPCYDELRSQLGGPESPRNDPDRVAAVNEVIDGLVAAHPARLATVELSPTLCPRRDVEASIDDVLLRPDGVHVSGPGAALVWERVILPQLREVRGQGDPLLTSDPTS